jgi:hypothetical protein
VRDQKRKSVKEIDGYVKQKSKTPHAVVSGGLVPKMKPPSHREMQKSKTATNKPDPHLLIHTWFAIRCSLRETKDSTPEMTIAKSCPSYVLWFRPCRYPSQCRQKIQFMIFLLFCFCKRGLVLSAASRCVVSPWCRSALWRIVHKPIHYSVRITP